MAMFVFLLSFFFLFTITGRNENLLIPVFSNTKALFVMRVSKHSNILRESVQNQSTCRSKRRSAAVLLTRSLAENLLTDLGDVLFNLPNMAYLCVRIYNHRPLSFHRERDERKEGERREKGERERRHIK